MINGIYRILIERQKIIFIILSILFWIGAISYSLYLADELRYPDELWYFEDYAKNIVKFQIFSRDGLNPTAFHPPMYPILLSVIIHLGFGIIGARMINFLAMYLTILLIYRFLRKNNYRLAPIISVLLILFYPVLFYTAGTLYPQTVSAFFLVSSVLLFSKNTLAKKEIIFSGILLGVAILTNPTFIFVPFLMLVFSLLFRKKILLNSFLILIIAFLTILPWTIRNYIVFDRFNLISTNLGTNFLIGNNPATTSNNGPNAWVGAIDIFQKASDLNLDEFEKNEYFMNEALSNIRNNPIRYSSLYISKLLNHFNFRNKLASDEESSLLNDILLFISYYFLLATVIVRLLAFKQFPISKIEFFFYILYIAFAFVSAVVFTRIRYRLPFDYFLIVLGSIFFDKVAQRNFEQQKYS